MGDDLRIRTWGERPGSWAGQREKLGSKAVMSRALPSPRGAQSSGTLLNCQELGEVLPSGRGRSQRRLLRAAVTASPMVMRAGWDAQTSIIKHLLTTVYYYYFHDSLVVLFTLNYVLFSFSSLHTH